MNFKAVHLEMILPFEGGATEASKLSGSCVYLNMMSQRVIGFERFLADVTGEPFHGGVRQVMLLQIEFRLESFMTSETLKVAGQRMVVQVAAERVLGLE